MIIIQPMVKIDICELDQDKLISIEKYARVCYKSQSDNSSNATFLKKIISSGHESVIEHEKASVLFIVDRGVTHQIIRHRIASYSHESTRYCNYSSGKFGNEITVVEPFFFDHESDAYNIWKTACLNSETAYMKLCETVTAEQARSVLPNSLKAELVVTYNFREWRHFFKLRCSKHAHPQMRQITIPLLILFKKQFCPIFDDIPYDIDFPASNYAKIMGVKNGVEDLLS